MPSRHFTRSSGIIFGRFCSDSALDLFYCSDFKTQNLFFWEIDCCVSSFIWYGTLPQLVKFTLHPATCCGGLTLPIFQMYYWVAILVTVALVVYWISIQCCSLPGRCISGLSFGALESDIERPEGLCHAPYSY